MLSAISEAGDLELRLRKVTNDFGIIEIELESAGRQSSVRGRGCSQAVHPGPAHSDHVKPIQRIRRDQAGCHPGHDSNVQYTMSSRTYSQSGTPTFNISILVRSLW